MGYVHEVASRIEALEGLDGPFARMQSLVRRAIPPGPVKDLLSGTFVDHPLHPILTDLPIGAWTNSMLLDFLGGRKMRSASQMLVGFGVLTAIPTAVTGWNDGADTEGRTARVVSVHAVANSTALVLYAGSWRSRRRGHHLKGVALGVLGATAATVGGALGGEIVYSKGIGVNQTAFDDFPSDWTGPDKRTEVPADAAIAVTVAGVEVLVVRDDLGTLHALGDRCTHRGGPLHEGSVEGGCVTCPWHASRFQLADGAVVAGPATVPQPVYDLRVENGGLELRALKSSQ